MEPSPRSNQPSTTRQTNEGFGDLRYPLASAADRVKNSVTASAALILTGVFAGVLCVPVAAQETPELEDDDVVTIETLIVTARRREEDIRRVPGSVAVKTGAFLEAARHLNGQDALRDIPGVGLGTPGDKNNAFIVVRGVGPLIDPLSPTDTSVVTFIDGAPQSIMSAYTGYLDLQRVEVLKGPQSTLLGRNTTGGAINLVPVKPGETFEGYTRGEFATDSIYRLEAIATVPLVEDLLSSRFALRRYAADAYIDNLFGDDLGSEDTWIGRASFLLTPGLRTDVLLTIGGEVADDVPALGVLKFEDSDPQIAAQNVNFEENEHWTTSLRIDHEFDRFVFTSQTSYVDASSTQGFNFVDLRIAGALFGLPPETFSDPARNFAVRDRDEENFFQEFRLTSAPDTSVGWTVGAVYYYDVADYTVETNFVDWFGPSVSGTQTYDLTTTGAAVFGDVDFPLSDRWSVNVGGRLAREEKDFTGTFTEDGTVVGLVVPFFREDDSVDFDYWAGKAAIRYVWTDQTSTYAKISRGVKTGGYGVLEFGAPFGNPRTPYDTTTIIAYEIGARTTLLDGRLDLDAVVFFNDVEDEQISAFDFATGFNQPLNSDTRASGIEVSARWDLSDLISLNLGAAYTDSELVNVSDEFQAAQPGSEDGNQLPNTPEWAATAVLDYRASMTDMGLSGALANVGVTGRLSYNYLGERFYDPANFGRMEAAHILAARLGLDWGGGEVYLFGENLLDELILTSNIPFLAGPPPPTIFYGAYDRGRVVGAGLAFYFD